MTKLLTILRNDRGAAAIEMAFAVPILAVFLWGIFEIGIMFQANAGMQHALGEGARYATLWPAPSNAQIKQRIQDKVFGVGVGDFTAADPVNGSNYKDLSVTFTMETNFLFFRGPDIDITRSKRVYIAS
ncbi:MAG TPA: TadE/TadG family type IV pilus assembly protein [Sphingomicrobium sp.]|jgi:Flp pilus assembly protein TadG